MFLGAEFGPICGVGREQPIEIGGAQSARPPIDAEALIAWALQRSGRLPWGNARDRDLAFDRGVTAKPRSAPHVGWGVAEVCAGLSVNGRALVRPQRNPGPDAIRVLVEIGMLDPARAALVIACGRASIRPDWMPGVTPREVRRVKRTGKKRRRIAIVEWSPCSPEAIRAAREAYRRWHSGVAAVARRLDGELDGWEIQGFTAPAEPWKMVGEKNA